MSTGPPSLTTPHRPSGTDVSNLLDTSSLVPISFEPFEARITASLLNTKLDGVRQELTTISDAYLERAGRLDTGMPHETYKALYNGFEDEARLDGHRVVDAFRDSLLACAEKFAAVFQTERGSVYFMTHDAGAFRIQAMEPGADAGRRIRDIADTTVFITTETAEHFLKNFRGSQQFLAKFESPFPVHPLEAGVIPLDLFGAHRIERSAESLATVSYEPSSRNRAFHVGHEITRVIFSSALIENLDRPPASDPARTASTHIAA